MTNQHEFNFSFEEIVEQALDSIIITDLEVNPPGPRILYVNDAFQKLSGYTSEEVIGRSPRFLQGADTDPNSIKKIRQALVKKSPIRISLKNYTKQGKEYWIEVSIIPLHNSTGEVTHFAAIQRDISEQKRNENELNILSRTDPLTGTINRRAFEDLILKHYEQRHSENCFVMILDIDNFKTINDTFGHQTGDEYLKHFASTLKVVVRESDKISRFGGEEFCIILPNVNEETANNIAQRICSAVQELTLTKNKKTLSTTVSIGLSKIASTDQSEKDVLARADEALYEAKRHGKNRFKLFSA